MIQHEVCDGVLYAVGSIPKSERTTSFAGVDDSSCPSSMAPRPALTACRSNPNVKSEKRNNFRMLNFDREQHASREDNPPLRMVSTLRRLSGSRSCLDKNRPEQAAMGGAS